MNVVFRSLLAIALATLLPNIGHAQAATTDQTEILALVQQFQKSIETRDTALLRSLFHNGEIVWIGVGHPKSFALVKQYRPEMKQVQQAGAYQSIADPRTAGVPRAEVFLNPDIKSDGQLATATFDYAFKVNNVISNWGKESWHLVKTDAGWKIIHLIYSYHLVQVEPAPALYNGN